MQLFLSYHALSLYLYLCRYILSYNLKSFSLFFGSLLLKSCGCFSSYNFELFNHHFLFHCFIRRCSHPRVECFEFRSSFSSFSIRFQFALSLKCYCDENRVFWKMKFATLNKPIMWRNLHWKRAAKQQSRTVRVSRLRTGTYRVLLSAIWVLVAQWLQRLTGDQKVAGSIPVCGSETFFWVCNKAWVANSFPLIYQAESHPHTYISLLFDNFHVVFI